MWVRFQVDLYPVVKKNGRDIGYNKKTGQRFPIKSVKLKTYEEQATLILQSQLNKMGVKKPLFTEKLAAKYFVFFEGESPMDWENSIQAIQDCAQKAGIIANDKLIKSAQVILVENSGEVKTVIEFAILDQVRKGYAKLFDPF